MVKLDTSSCVELVEIRIREIDPTNVKYLFAEYCYTKAKI